ncbi:MAG: hypothetical protein WCZ27_09050 [Tissierellaceae bacterium]
MERKKKIRIIISISILLIGLIFSLFFTTITHKILSTKNLDSGKLPGLREIFYSLRSSKQHLYLFLSFVVISLLGSIAFYLSFDRAYSSDLQMITPDIYTPARAGQNQHGSARWMTEKEKDKYLSFMMIDPKDKRINKLINNGYEEVE